MMHRAIGGIEVTDKGIERVIDVGDYGTYTTELILPKEAFIEAYQKYIKTDDGSLSRDELDFAQPHKKIPATLDLEPCENAINRQATIDAIENHHLDKTDMSLETEDAVKFGMATALESVESVQRWIPVSERLPCNYNEDWVLAQIQEVNGYLWIPKVCEYSKIKNDWYCEETGWLKNHNGAFRVVAWMPLPEPWKGGD